MACAAPQTCFCAAHPFCLQRPLQMPRIWNLEVSSYPSIRHASQPHVSMTVALDTADVWDRNDMFFSEINFAGRFLVSWSSKRTSPASISVQDFAPFQMKVKRKVQSSKAVHKHVKSAIRQLQQLRQDVLKHLSKQSFALPSRHP